MATIVHAADLHIDRTGAVRASRQAVVRLVVYPGSGSAAVVTSVAGAIATVEHRELATLVPG